MVEVKIKDSLIGGLINGVINGAIAWFIFKGKETVPLSLDLISTHEVSVWGQAVSLSFGLGIILSIITSKIFISHTKKVIPEAKWPLLDLPIFPNLFKIALNSAAFLFGWFVALAVIWTKIAGVVHVSAMLATILVGVFAFIVTIVVEYRTKKSLIFKQVNILE